MQLYFGKQIDGFIELSKVSVPRSFTSNPPSQKTIDKKRRLFEGQGFVGPITLNETSLVDGYVAYLEAERLKMRSVCFVFKEEVKETSSCGVFMQLWTSQFGICYICGEAMLKSKNKDRLNQCTIDHIQPRCSGGTNDIRNLALAHRRCNELKGQLHISEELKEIIKQERRKYG